MFIKKTKVWELFSSIKLAIWLLSVIALLSLIGTLVPQNQEQGKGLADIYSSWYFILCLILLSLNLFICIFNRLSLKVRTLGSLISHISILVILLGAFIGVAFGQKGYLTISKKETASSFFTKDKPVDLGFSVRLDDFIYTENIDSKEGLLVYSVTEKAACSMHESPELNGSEKLIAKIPTETGKEWDIADTGYKIKVLRYLPDFVMDLATKKITSKSSKPNNPAIEAELKDKAGKTRVIWVFARYPQAHKGTGADLKFVYNWQMRRPKDYISKVTIIKDGKEMMSRDIRVNEPLSFGGYTFFQSSYDSEALNWSGLRVVNDPGVPVIYLGFFLLIAGLIMIFYVNPLIRGR